MDALAYWESINIGTRSVNLATCGNFRAHVSSGWYIRSEKRLKSC